MNRDITPLDAASAEVVFYRKHDGEVYRLTYSTWIDTFYFFHVGGYKCEFHQPCKERCIKDAAAVHDVYVCDHAAFDLLLDNAVELPA